MTAQVSDTYIYKDKRYNIVAFSEPLVFHPQAYSLKIYILTQKMNIIPR